jgi:2,4-dienoyl-CoA reductase-like NADH-dependent reductase (Old Yellow Enzyme family)
VGLGRALLADPEWPNKAREGRWAEIDVCIYCRACRDMANNGELFHCVKTANGLSCEE